MAVIAFARKDGQRSAMFPRESDADQSARGALLAVTEHTKDLPRAASHKGKDAPKV
jgi:hypothetical protein